MSTRPSSNGGGGGGGSDGAGGGGGGGGESGFTPPLPEVIGVVDRSDDAIGVDPDARRRSQTFGNDVGGASGWGGVGAEVGDRVA